MQKLPRALALFFFCSLFIARAASITFSGSSGSLSASASFSSCNTNQLCVTLTNTSNFDVLVPIDVLTGVSFNTTSSVSLTGVSATVAPGSTVHFGTTDPGGVVGGEWGYGTGGGALLSYVIASAGYLGTGTQFPGTDLQPPVSLDGLQYGITSAGDNLATGNTPVTGTNALIKNQVQFVLAGLPQGFDPSNEITAVRFQYGTATTEPYYDGNPNDTNVPEPGAIFLLGGGLAVLAVFRR